MTIKLPIYPTVWLIIVAGLLVACQGSPPAAIATPIGERAYADRPDDFPDKYQVHLLYILPADAKDQQLDLNGTVNKSIEAINNWFYEQSGDAKVRFDTYQGQLDITFVQMEMTSAEFYEAAIAKYGGPDFIRDILEEELLKANIFRPGKIYVAWFEIDKHPNTCADAAHPPDLMGRLAGLYPSAVVEAGWDCADEPFGVGYAPVDMGLIHEIVHLLGFASACGLNPISAENTAHTGDDNRDLMWAPMDRADVNEFWDAENMLLDPGNDDYFKHNIANCPDLANSVFLDPLPANPETPPGWPAEWKLP